MINKIEVGLFGLSGTLPALPIDLIGYHGSQSTFKPIKSSMKLLEQSWK
jgi:hypothetical protein